MDSALKGARVADRALTGLRPRACRRKACQGTVYTMAGRRAAVGANAAGNRSLGAAKTAKKDEFYTQLSDIEKGAQALQEALQRQDVY
jgi:hypothetical protein